MLNAGIMTNEEFENIVKSKRITVVDFSATWCGPCRMMAPILEDISDKYKGKYYFYQVDIDSESELAENYNITAVPTIIIFYGGRELSRVTGCHDFDEFEKYLLKTIKEAGV